MTDPEASDPEPSETAASETEEGDAGLALERTSLSWTGPRYPSPPSAASCSRRT